MRYRRRVLDDQDPLARHRRGFIKPDRRGCIYDRSPGVDGAQFRHRSFDICGRSGIHFVYDKDIGHSARLQSIRHNDVQIRADKRKIVIAAVPHDDVGLLLGGGEYRLIIDAGKDDNAQCYMRLVLLPLLDCAISGIEIGGRGETLDTLPQEIAIRHRMPEDGDLSASLAQPTRQPARNRRFAATGAHRSHGDYGPGRSQHRSLRPQ
jgi:hypothetical protein